MIADAKLRIGEGALLAGLRIGKRAAPDVAGKRAAEVVYAF
jgi:hypothetical protein